MIDALNSPKFLSTPHFDVKKTQTDEDKIKGAKEFEGMFMKFVLERIFPKEESGFFGEGNAGEFYKSFFVDAVSKEIAKKGVGVSQYIIKALNRSDASLVQSNSSIKKGEMYENVV